MAGTIDKAGLKVAAVLARFIEEEALPGTGIEPTPSGAAWPTSSPASRPRTGALLATRDALQAQIDAWHDAHRRARRSDAYQAFLREIGYLVDEPAPLRDRHRSNVDDEIARIAGPQLVVPVLNARFLLNAANARWGSLYDALYGTDALPGAAGGPAATIRSAARR